ncbi:hypothetical protein B9P99_02550 [Candidatus Marsarchaeota G1 archaeon OSP_B]|uniref:Uncharacterized protein n=2 Tax=Candidatus Marsarchaeota group 1 TaxID=2203770 RepID=A0A2R6A9M4_9ARCH|nr:MAG: hypothetical protein B9Q01_06175 [Candidatus Marsarchaeota G1 archaeon OSP_D]PSN93278.1 MAG: hypothetical protein B9P99_02550 [Candidatus Marsarchaeota G1 archaeon OSP_B]
MLRLRFLFLSQVDSKRRDKASHKSETLGSQVTLCVKVKPILLKHSLVFGFLTKLPYILKLPVRVH